MTDAAIVPGGHAWQRPAGMRWQRTNTTIERPTARQGRFYCFGIGRERSWVGTSPAQARSPPCKPLIAQRFATIRPVVETGGICYTRALFSMWLRSVVKGVCSRSVTGLVWMRKMAGCPLAGAWKAEAAHPRGRGFVPGPKSPRPV